MNLGHLGTSVLARLYFLLSLGWFFPNQIKTRCSNYTIVLFLSVPMNLTVLLVNYKRCTL